MTHRTLRSGRVNTELRDFDEGIMWQERRRMEVQWEIVGIERDGGLP
jgi:hypothetical protein